MCIAIICWSGRDVINFEINLSNQAGFSISPKRADKNLNILRTKRPFQDEIKSIFHHF